MNNDHFNIEFLSNDGWKEIGWQKGKGNSTHPEYYSYETLGSYSDGSIFRLKQTDYDGTTSFSQLIKLSNKNMVNFIFNYPIFY